MGNLRTEILDTAKEIVSVDRSSEYGEPEDSFGTIADLWSTALSASLKQDIVLDSTDVAQLMILLKVARTLKNPGHRDSWIDIAGYAACGADTALDTETLYRPNEQEILEAAERLAKTAQDRLGDKLLEEASTPEGQSLLRRLGLENADLDTLKGKILEAAGIAHVNPLDFDAVKEVIRERGLAA